MFVRIDSIGLRNDPIPFHKLLTKLIEEQLHQIHTQARREGTAIHGNERCLDKRPSVFAQVNPAGCKSPASDAVGYNQITGLKFLEAFIQKHGLTMPVQTSFFLAILSF